MKRDLHLFILQIKEDLNQSGHSCFSLRAWPSSEIQSDLSHLLRSVGCSENTKQLPEKAGAVFHTALHCQFSLPWVRQCVCVRFWSWKLTKHRPSSSAPQPHTVPLTDIASSARRKGRDYGTHNFSRTGQGWETTWKPWKVTRGTACNKATGLWQGNASGSEGDIWKLPTEKDQEAPLKLQGTRDLNSSLQISLCDMYTPFLSFPLTLLCQLPLCFSCYHQALFWWLLFNFSTAEVPVRN